MRRLLVAAALVGGGVVGSRALTRRYAVSGLGEAIGPALAELREVAGLVRAGMQEREGELRMALGLDLPPQGTRVDPVAVRELLEDPARPRAAQG